MVLMTPVRAQESSVAQDLMQRLDFESKRMYYLESPLTLDDVTRLLDQSTQERERLELLLFYLKRQFSYDISIGRDQALEALQLARKYGLKLHESIALQNLTTATCLFVPSQEAHQVADSAITISEEIKDYGLTSSIYYTKYVIDLVNEDDVSGINNLLKCVEMAEQHGSAATRNERRLRLLKFAIENGNHALATNLLDKLEQETLNLENQLIFLIEYGHLKYALGNRDSAKYFYEQALKLRVDFETCFAMGLWYRNYGPQDSAIYFLNRSIDLTDPRRSYIGDKYLVLADIYESKGDYPKAKHYLQKRLNESIRLVEKANEALNYAELANFYFRREQIDSASQYALKSYDLAKTNNFHASLYESVKILAQLSTKQGRSDEANQYLNELLALAELNKEQQIAARLKKAEMDRNVDYWVQVGEEKLKRAEQLRNLIIIITVLLLLLLFSLLKILRNKKKALKTQESLNKMMVAQRDQIAEQGERLQEMNDSLSTTNDALERKVSERTSELAAANDQLTRYSKRLEEYANITAHNLRGPLVNIAGLTNIYNSEKMSSEDQLNVVRLIRKSAGEIDEVMWELNALLDLEQTHEIKKERISMPELIADLEDWIREKAVDAELEFKGWSALDEVYSVRPYLERTLRELLINSYHYRHLERELDINLSVEDRSGNMEIKVADNGLGIDLDKFGNEIFRLNQRFHQRNGRGVGLYLVKRQVEAMQGTVSVTSEPGSGSCFIVSLPRESYAV